MGHFPLLMAFSTATLLAQKGDLRLPPDIVPPGLTFRDVLDVDPAHYRKEFENDQIRVLRLRLKPDETVPMHEASDGLFVCVGVTGVRDCHIRLMDPNGHPQDIHLEHGETRWIWAGTRTEKNLSSQPVEMLLIENKSKNPSS